MSFIVLYVYLIEKKKKKLVPFVESGLIYNLAIINSLQKFVNQ